MKKHKPKTKIGVCEYHLCKKKTKVFLCKYCKRYFCKEHIKPKPVLNLKQVSTAKEPLRSKLEKMWRSEKGHPDYSYTPIFWRRIEEEEKIKTERIQEILDSLKNFKEVEENKEPKVVEPTTLTEIPPTHIEKEHKSKREERVSLVKVTFKLRKLCYSLSKLAKKMFFWYLIYFFLLGLFIYLSEYYVNYYIILISYFQYPLYLLSLVLGFYLPYKLFKKFEHKEPRSDLQLWLWRILSGVLVFVSAILLVFGLIFFVSSVVAKVGKEIGYSISIFFGCLCLGILLFSSYLLFKYKIRSGIIIHRGEW